ncbi:MAG: hypothetical protein CL710_02095 [Chloroflexi bacterium]|nr:hypothetical protein [Chloroflexota bacterium]|tara:strand:- start:27829 stop:28341 length:513 start_codon:yes stop_codon:yes gene_type:complete
MVIANQTSEAIFTKKITKNKKIRLEKNLNKRINMTPYIFLSIFICIMGMIQVLATDKISTIGYETKTIKAINNDLNAEIAEIEVEIATLIDIDSIHLRAKELGMVKKDTNLFITSESSLIKTSFIPEKYKYYDEALNKQQQEQKVDVAKNIFSDFISFINKTKDAILKLF